MNVIKGINGAGPETVRYAPSSAMDVVAAGIVNRALYTAIVQRSLPTAANAILEAVLASPDVEIPPGTGSPADGIGSSFKHAESRSLSFVPDDGCLPIHQIISRKTDPSSRGSGRIVSAHDSVGKFPNLPVRVSSGYIALGHGGFFPDERKVMAREAPEADRSSDVVPLPRRNPSLRDRVAQNVAVTPPSTARICPVM